MKVFIVGGGPGDEELISLKAIESIEKSDVIIYDHLIPQSLIKFAKKDCILEYVGKQPGKHTISQDEINSLILKYSKEGKTVVRLKGGDPFIFGRGGEECEFLHQNGIEFEVIPGVSSVYAAPAYAGIPLTHRDYVSAFAVITGSEDPEKENLSIDWKSLRNFGTLVFLMGVKNLKKIVDKLSEEGWDPSTPCAIIEDGTTPLQKVVTGEICNIVKKAEESSVKPPSVLVIGDVVKLRDKIKWFEKKALFGKKVVVTRAEGDAESLSKLLKREGAYTIEFPTIKVIPSDEKWIEKTVSQIVKGRKIDFAIFTSKNGVKFFFEQLNKLNGDSRRLSGIAICAVGKSTELELKKYGISADIVPEKYTTEELLKEIMKYRIRGKQIVTFRSDISYTDFEEKLRKKGAKVRRVETYRIVEAAPDEKLISEVMSADILTFTSSSSVENFVKIVGNTDILKNKITACIGEVTANAIRRFGAEPTVVSDVSTMEHLVKKLCDYLKSNG
mgnify:CR=1 FL=1